MKSKILTIIFLFAITIGNAQVQVLQPKNCDVLWVEPEYDTDAVCVSPEEHKVIKARVDEAAHRMRKSGILEKYFNKGSRMVHPLFDWPMQQADGFNDPGYYAISNYVDLDTSSGNSNVLDYNGLNQTYNTHKGIDIRTSPYFWKKMDDSHVEAIAATDGVIILKQDGNNDTSCACAGSGPWNAVFLMHADGSQSWYGHLKTNTTTAKDSGDLVNAGEYLGVIGSSGCSTNPHLHFEVYDDSGNLIEPFFGPSNYTTNDSWWANQLPYYDSAINKLATHSAPPSTPACPGIEVPNEKFSFNQGDAITFSIAIRHSLTSDSAVIEVFEPDGDQSNILNTTYIRGGTPFLRAVLPTWNRNLSNTAEQGKWKYRVTYYSSSYAPKVEEINFWVKEDCVANIVHNNPLNQSTYYQTSNTITSTSTVGNGVHIVYDSENVTTLLPGFIAPVGSKLEIKLAGCN